MNRFLKYLFGLTLLAAIFTGCSDDDDYDYMRWVSYGTVETKTTDASSGYFIRIDNGSYLDVFANYSGVRLKDDDRVAINYTLLDEYTEAPNGEKAHGILIRDAVVILSKSPVKQSFIDEDKEKREDSLGYDPIRIIDEMWFGGKYLNVRFKVAVHQYGNNEQHFLNIVEDDVDVEPNGVVNLTLRHNGFDDVPTSGNSGNFIFGHGIVSFDISSLVPEGQQTVKIKVRWKDYGNTWLSDTVDRSDEGEFRPYASQTGRQFKSEDIDMQVE